MESTWASDLWEHPVIVQRHRPNPQPIVSQPTPEPAGRRRGSPEPMALEGMPFPTRWSLYAACRGMAPDDGTTQHPFFPHRGQDQGPIVDLCDRCPVQIPCREYAAGCGANLKGIFGGLNERQRRQDRRRRTA